MIKNLGLSQTVEWIPVTERLPEEYEAVQIAHAGGVVMGLLLAHDRWADDCFFEVDGVTHWAQPLKHPDQLSAVSPEGAEER
jgi:hypothetical protein